MLHRVLEYARGRKKEVVIVLLDLADAFGSVPHEVIRRTLAVPARVVDTKLHGPREESRRIHRGHPQAVGSTAL